jgi:asparagine synthase (glutamine-hydrolysing)
MCGIAGAVGSLSLARSRDGSAGERVAECVARVSDALRHRGPDGSGTWCTERREVVFAHRRLAIIDLSEGGAQPMVDAATGCAITYNGEIYNFQELRRELESGGASFLSNSDTEVVLKAFVRWGLDAIPRLRGIFAMGIWDPRSRSVHLVRDQMGIKPLYWTIVRGGGALGGETLLFASEVRSLLASGVVPRKLDAAGVASYLAQGFVVGPNTIVEGVRLLPGASILSLSPGIGSEESNTLALKRYWELPAGAAGSATEQDLHDVLANTVRMQLISDAPLGIFLSGGIDSSAVAAPASDAAPGAVHTFTIGFEEKGLDESRYAAAVAAAIRSRHTNVVLREEDFLAQLPDSMTAIDQPTFDAINTYFVSRAARNAGMTVALAGTGGDELFGGYRSFVELPKMMRGTSWLPRRQLDVVMRGAAGLSGGIFWDILKRAPPQTRWGKLADVARAANDLLALYQVSYSLFTAETQERLASSAVRSVQSEQVLGLPAAVADNWRHKVRDESLLHAISMLELSSFIGERLLRDTDAASMAVALEVRVPLLDHVLCETVAGLDPALRFKPLLKKMALRRAGLSKLNPSLFDRPKSGFVLPIAGWIRRGLRAELDRIFTDTALIERVGLNAGTVQKLWSSYTSGRRGLHWSRVWSIYVLLAWCRAHDISLAV